MVASKPATLLQLDWSGVRIVAVAPYLWHDGSAIDLVSLRTRCDAAGAWLAVDGTQSIGQLAAFLNHFQIFFRLTRALHCRRESI